MAWTAITAAQTDADSPIDQLLMDTLRLNDADHETRLVVVEAASVNERVFDHFNRTDGTPTGFDASQWTEEISGSAQAFVIGTTLHELLMETRVTGDRSRLTSKIKFRPSDRPRFHIRIAHSVAANLQPLLVGLQNDRALATDAVADGIYFFKPTGADTNTVIEVARASATTQSSTFTIAANSTYFDIIIDYVATNRAVVTVDGTERMDITDGNLPRAQEELYAMVHWQTDTSSTSLVGIDRFECVSQAPVDLV